MTDRSSVGSRVALFLLVASVSMSSGAGSAMAATTTEAERTRRFVRMDYLSEEKATHRPGFFSLQFDGEVEAQLQREVGIPLVYVDVLGARIDLSPTVIPLATGPARLVRLTQLTDRPPVVRGTFFLRRSARPKVQTRANRIEIEFREAGRQKGFVSSVARRPTPFGLEKPSSKPPPRRVQKIEHPIRLEFHGEKASKILQGLAWQAGMGIHFRDPVETPITERLLTRNLLEAMDLIADRAGAKLTVEEGEIWISSPDNPALVFSDRDYVEEADLRGLPLGDVIKAMGRVGRINVFLDTALGGEKDTPVDLVFQKMTCRRAFETILEVHHLKARRLDRTSVLVSAAKPQSRSEEKPAAASPILRVEMFLGNGSQDQKHPCRKGHDWTKFAHVQEMDSP